MIGESVSRSRVDDIVSAEGVPGLFNVRLENGEVFRDLPTRLTDELVRRNGLVHHLPVSPSPEEPGT